MGRCPHRGGATALATVDRVVRGSGRDETVGAAMRRFGTAAIAGAAMMMALTGCAGGADDAGDSGDNAAFAKEACTGWSEMLAADDADNDVLSSLMDVRSADRTAEDGPVQKQAILDAANAHVATIQAARDAVADNPPAGEDAKAIVKAFTDHYDARIEIAEARIAEFEEFPTVLERNYDQVITESQEVLKDIGEYGDGQPDGFPFGDIEDQKVITALDEESSCEDVINVF
jgi:hypothetical protein